MKPCLRACCRRGPVLLSSLTYPLPPSPFIYLLLLQGKPRLREGEASARGLQFSIPGLRDLLPGQCQEAGKRCSSDHLELLTRLICPHPSLPPIFSLLIWLLPPPPLPETCGLLTHLSTWCREGGGMRERSQPGHSWIQSRIPSPGPSASPPPPQHPVSTRQ